MIGTPEEFPIHSTGGKHVAAGMGRIWRAIRHWAGKPIWSLPAGGQFQDVPAGELLRIYTATLSYLPEDPKATIGRADLAGRNAAGTAIWRLQIVYVEPQRTLHLTFPQGLTVGAGGWVEVFASADGDASPHPTGTGEIW